MGFQIIEDKLQEKVTKQQFLKECGIMLIGIIFVPNLIQRIINKNRFKIIGNIIYLDDELLIERRDV